MRGGTETMAAPQIDYGQAHLKAFNDAVSAGVVRFDEHAARAAERLYAETIDDLTRIRANLADMTRVAGFGGFPSGLGLQDGFSRKAAEGVAVLDQLISGAMQLQEAYLRAAGQLRDADAITAARLRRQAGDLV
jgi:hypothetical protein